MGTNRDEISGAYLEVLQDCIDRLEMVDKKYHTFAKVQLPETRISAIGSGIPEFIRTPHIHELLFYPQPVAPALPRPAAAPAEAKPDYKLPDIDRKRFLAEDDYYTELYKQEFPDRSFFYAACGKYFKMTYNQVNPLIAGLNPDNAQERINAWRQVVRHELKKEA